LAHLPAGGVGDELLALLPVLRRLPDAGRIATALERGTLSTNVRHDRARSDRLRRLAHQALQTDHP
jgi:hypothetical protein